MDAQKEEEDEAETVGPYVDGVVVKCEKGGVETGAEGFLRRAIAAYDKVIVSHP